jgi:hypothetical protein
MSVREIWYHLHMAGVMGFTPSFLTKPPATMLDWLKLCMVLTIWRTPEEASEYLWERFRVKRNARRLAQLRATGEGPKFYRDGNVVRYRTDHLDEWAGNSLGEPASSTAEEHVRREAARDSEIIDASTT